VDWIIHRDLSCEGASSDYTDSRAKRQLRLLRVLKLVRLAKLFKYIRVYHEAERKRDGDTYDSESNVGAAMSDITSQR
jgi:hypothetical protein